MPNPGIIRNFNNFHLKHMEFKVKKFKRFLLFNDSSVVCAAKFINKPITKIVNVSCNFLHIKSAFNHFIIKVEINLYIEYMHLFIHIHNIYAC